MTNAFVSTSLQSVSASIASLVDGAARSIVAVHSHRSMASGFVWRPGLVITANDALADEGAIEVVLPGGETVPASLKGGDASTDIALLRIERIDVPPVAGSLDAVATGALALAIGAREGHAVAALGIVSHAGPAWRSVRGGDIAARIELDVTLRASAVGGVAIDATGRSIGMTVFGPRRRVLVIPSATIDRIAAKLDADGRIARGYLGLGLQPVAIEGAGEAVGAMVMTVDASGPGAAAGVRQGDVIVTWNERPLSTLASLLRELGPDSVGSVVKLSARRAGARTEFSLTVGARPDA